MFRIIIIVVSISVSVQALDVCSDWTQYGDTKCFKVIDEKVTEEEAVKRCLQLDSSSTLASIHTNDEQIFINNMALNYGNISTAAWIGLHYEKDSFNWVDDSQTNYTNWALDAAKDGEVKCVEMSLINIKETLGKWTDVSCKKTALAICQKKQTLDLSLLKNAIVNMENKMKDMQFKNDEQDKKLSEQQNELEKLIPISFLYTQLPDQSSPQQLWPNMKWTEVTQQYAGLFFRAEGGNSSHFGEEQMASSPKFTKINQHRQDDANNMLYNNYSISLKQGIETENFYTGSGANGVYYALSFYLSNEEVRPTNKAVKIWKRTG